MIVRAGVLVLLGAGGCAGGPSERALSELGFFVGEPRELEPAPGVLPFEVRSPLFSDFAGKSRFMVVPEGERVAVGAGEDWDYPPGTTLIKNFFFDLDRRDGDAGDHRLIETRLLELRGEGWVPSTWVWNEDQTDAFPLDIGDRITVEWIDEAGEIVEQPYEIPSLDHCASCHERDDEMTFLGPFTHQLNFPVERDGQTVEQLAWLVEQGAIEDVGDPGDLPAMVDPMGTDELDARARAYLHANCAHCHRDGGGAGVSGLWLTYWEPSPLHLGICKIPAAAGAGTGGRAFDIVPGAPDDSILVFRIESLDPDIKMPELPTRLLHPDGIALLREWIAAMSPDDCG